MSPEYTLRAVNYILGTHPVSSTSYVAGVGTVSKTKTYSNNRADNAYIPGAVIPGYIIIKPDFPECIDDFGFLWFEDEAVVAGSASWVVAGNAADAITKGIEVEPRTRSARWPRKVPSAFLFWRNPSRRGLQLHLREGDIQGAGFWAHVRASLTTCSRRMRRKSAEAIWPRSEETLRAADCRPATTGHGCLLSFT